MEKLALLGGEPSVKKSLAEISFDIVPESAYPMVNELMKSGQISMAPIVRELEAKFCEYTEAKYAICVPNGTTSIQTALFAVGVGAGDEVIVPSFTFWGTVGPVVACNAIPVFADCDRDTHCLTVETVEKCITDKTKAILIVHVWGTPCDMDGMVALAKKYNLKLVEDCSHAHGATYNGKKVGTIGDVGCYSMQASKLVPSGEGGIVITNDLKYYERCLAYGNCDRLGAMDDSCEYKKYRLTGMGYKHRISPISAAIAYSNLELLDERNVIRTKYAKYFEELISDIDFIVPQAIPEKAERVYGYHYGTYKKGLFGNLSLHTLLKALTAEGVTCGGCSYGMLHKAPVYNDGKNSPMHAFNCPEYGKEYAPPEHLANSEYLRGAAILMAPRFENVTESDIEAYAKAYHKVAASLDELLKYEEENGLAKKAVKNDNSSINVFKG